MNSQETLKFAERLMREVWLPLDAEAAPRFYQRNVVGYHRKQRLNYDDVVHRLVTDRTRHTDPTYDIQDIIAAEDKFAIRFGFTVKLASGQPISAEANYFYTSETARSPPSGSWRTSSSITERTTNLGNL